MYYDDVITNFQCLKNFVDTTTMIFFKLIFLIFNLVKTIVYCLKKFYFVILQLYNDVFKELFIHNLMKDLILENNLLNNIHIDKLYKIMNINYRKFSISIKK